MQICDPTQVNKANVVRGPNVILLSMFSTGIKNYFDITFHSKDIISYPLFVHAIRENINGLGSYHTRLKAECDTNPNH